MRDLFKKIEVDVGRLAKPRSTGLTIVLDTGLGPAGAADLMASAGEHVDYVKLAWGSSMITGALEEKIKIIKDGGADVLIGGKLFEYAYLHGRLDEMVAMNAATKLPIEVSDGVIDLDHAEKLRWIEKLAKLTEVFSEVGGKTSRHQRDWKRAVPDELSAGARHLVVEGREIGPPGMPPDKPFREDFVDYMIEVAGGPQRLVFEALERPQQVFLIKKIGPNVGLGNIRPGEVMTVESFRRGLKEHTLLSSHARLKAAAARGR
jgi:phosphosulfolactate synthase